MTSEKIVRLTFNKPGNGEVTQVLTLGNEFIQNCVKASPRSYRGGKSHWRNLPVKTKIKIHAKDLENDMNLSLVNIELIG